MTRKRFFAVAMTVLLLVIAIAFILRPAQVKGKETDPRGTEVRIDNFTFNPGTLTVAVNSAVTWVNKDDLPHVVASNDGLFKSKALDTDQAYSFTFTRAGTYAYYCSLHPTMVGTITVR